MGENKLFEKMQPYLHWIRQYNEEQFLRTGKRPLAFCRTYGCQQNVSDGEKLSGMLAEMGYVFCNSPQGADLVLYNTCAVRENAENRVFGNVGALLHEKRDNPHLLIALCGCMMQQPHIAEKIKKSYPYVDLVFGPHALPRFPELLYHKLTQGSRVIDITDHESEIAEHLPVRRDGTIKAWLPIMHGCDNFCTYCVVPLVRGRERSRQPDHIIEEARRLVADGYRELTLLGQNVNSYGKGLAQNINFAQLLQQLCKIEGDFRIRFMTSHPKDCTQDLMDTIAANPKICSHIHLPVQSGSDRILKEMNRGYTAEQYLALIDYARQKMPNVSFTSDIIVGFPGETKDDFAATLRLVEKVQYHSLFTFLYSKRAGTKAADMPDTTTDAEKKERFDRLLTLQQTIGAKLYGQLVGQTVRVLADAPSKTGPDYITGRTESNVIVDFKAPAEMIGQYADVKITKALNWAVLGELKHTL